MYVRERDDDELILDHFNPFNVSCHDMCTLQTYLQRGTAKQPFNKLTFSWMRNLKDLRFRPMSCELSHCNPFKSEISHEDYSSNSSTGRQIAKNDEQLDKQAETTLDTFNDTDSDPFRN